MPLQLCFLGNITLSRAIHNVGIHRLDKRLNRSSPRNISWIDFPATASAISPEAIVRLAIDH